MRPFIDTQDFLSVKVVMTRVNSYTRLIKLVGELDNLAFRDLSVFVDDRLADDDRAVVVDFTDLSFSDSACLKLISGLAHRFGVDNCAVVGVNPNIRRLLSLTPLAKKAVELSEAGEWSQWRGAPSSRQGPL